ncbi:Zinc finger BED domain-containing protein DAYSLEEPER [Fusarium oxysporum f. sp. rapae]|uniref:Zinc finger BED domain-containing protein DAYSLEEPER n=1 Tax=Fusarium oxysporum f. sp. rapae TaxID=485398 RepID=A0A8J5NQ60_FUSOX|nr:Zinc finger BED domain-containing protein DAYSLEEPER [Fusarium oxysporum f. sp. rapae]
MASSSPISSTSAQLTAIERLGWDFYSFFRVEYPEKNKTQIGRVRKSYGRREYVCLHCSTRWSNGYTSNAITHAQNRHRQLIQASETSQNSQQSTQPSIDSYIAFQPSDSALRNVFNAQRWILSDIEWIDFNPKRRRIRCIGHIINLSLQSFLLARSKEALTAALNATISDESVDMVDHFAATLAETITHQEEPVLQGKRSKSTAKASQKTGIDEVYTGCDSWRDAVGLSLGIDNATRWSSWYKVIDNAIRKKVQINQFLLEHDRELEDTVLSGSDWDLLAKTHAFLEPFASATLYAEGKCSSVSQSLFLMDALLFHYESAKVQHSQPGSIDTRMLHAIEMGWFVLDKYYTMTEDVPVYAAALLLDPSKRLAYIQQNWPRDWHEAAIAGARDIWMTEYQGLAISKEPERRPAPLPSKKDGQLSFLFRSIEVKQKAISTDSDNLDSFINALPLEIDCTPLEWWSRLEQRAQYPRLGRMAIDILSIPSESAEPERAFSGARRTASWDRLRITCKNLEKVECIGNWLREGLIVPSGEGGLGLVCNPLAADDGAPMDVGLQDD